MQERPAANRNVLAYSLLAASGFALVAAYVILARAGLVYLLFVLPIAYLFAGVLLLTFVASSRRRISFLCYVLLGAALLVGGTSAFTAAHGYPFPYHGFATSCTTIKIQNATSPGGYTFGSSCSQNPTESPMSFVWNFLYWLPASGLAVYAIPNWRKGSSLAEKAGFGVIGAVILVALLLPLTGLLVAGS